MALVKALLQQAVKSGPPAINQALKSASVQGHRQNSTVPKGGLQPNHKEENLAFGLGVFAGAVAGSMITAVAVLLQSPSGGKYISGGGNDASVF